MRLKSFEIQVVKNDGIKYVLISVGLFVVVYTFVKFLARIPAQEIILFRSIVSLSLSLIQLRILKISPWGNNKKWLVVRGISGITALTMFFYTIKHMPLASAVTIQYLSPVFTVVLAIFINKQRVNPIQWLYLFMAFIGVIFIKGWDDRISVSMLLIGMLAAFFAGLAYNAIIKCRKTDHPVVIVMYFPLIATPVMAIWSWFYWVQPIGVEWILLLAIGALTQAAQIYMTKALHADHASKITPFKYLGTLFALFVGYAIFDERLHLFSLLGMGLVVFGVIMNSRQKLKPLT